MGLAIHGITFMLVTVSNGEKRRIGKHIVLQERKSHNYLSWQFACFLFEVSHCKIFN